jgi:hypothetical protein
MSTYTIFSHNLCIGMCNHQLGTFVLGLSSMLISMPHSGLFSKLTVASSFSEGCDSPFRICCWNLHCVSSFRVKLLLSDLNLSLLPFHSPFNIQD